MSLRNQPGQHVNTATHAAQEEIIIPILNQNSSLPGGASGQAPSKEASESIQRSQRKAAPSPLHTSTISQSSQSTLTPTPTRTTFVKSGASSQSPSTLSPAVPSPADKPPRSPKERLDDLLASERSFYRFDEVKSMNLPNGSNDRELPSNVTNGSTRSVSETLAITKGKKEPHPVLRPAPVASNAPQHKLDLGQPQLRNSSIDSAISNISTSSLSKSTDDSSMAEEDIAKLIQAAGSSESAIKYLLKEKHSLGTQNAQLWRLVDKQRAMILGLNKDLERALKDKERYRKKLKETLASAAPTFNSSTSTQNAGDSSPESRTDSQQARHVEALISAGLRDMHRDELPPSPIEVALAPYPITPPPQSTNAPQSSSNMTQAKHSMPAASEHAYQNYDSEATSAKAVVSSPEQSELVGSIKYNASVPPSRGLPVDPPPATTRATDVKKSSAGQQHEAADLAEFASVIDDKINKFPPPPSRKGPPAPLKLGPSINTSSHLHHATSAEEDESDYDDVLEVDEIPATVERGRRKTREEDDRERELVEQKNAELRSLSKKSKSSKSRPKATVDSEASSTVAAMPNAPRTFGIQPPASHNQHLAPQDAQTGSIAGIMTMTNGTSHSDTSSSRTLMAPPMSPGLPVSPRPQDRVASPPLSPRGMNAFPTIPLSPRAPRQPIPMPPNTPMSLVPPAMPAPLAVPSLASQSIGIEHGEESVQESAPNAIHQGFVRPEYPGLLLSPDALPSVTVQVASSRLKPSRASLMFPMKLDEDPVFTLAICSRTNGRELWRVEKDSASLASIDQILKQFSGFAAKAPDKSLFSGHAPAKIDARRAALNQYLDEVFETPFDGKTALELCKYISTNTMEPVMEDSAPSSATRGDSPGAGPGGRPTKNGYLTKRGKNFGGWKARFFVLDGPILKYYEAPGGAHLGSIKLPKAEIGKQAENKTPSPEQDDPDNQYRHAFLIMEPKKKDSSSKVRHVLCAESDKERDQWVFALLQYVDYVSDEADEEPENAAHNRNVSNDSHSSSAKKKVYGQGRILNVPEVREEDQLMGISYEATAQGSLPHGARSGPVTETPSPPPMGHERDPMMQAANSKQPISGPKNATLISDTGAWGNKSIYQGLAPAEEKRQKKRSFFGFGSKPRPSSDSEHGSDSTSNLTALSYEQHGPIRACFGAPLSEAVRYNHPADVNVELPAVVYRCIEYLDAKNAANEEGIFRLSGSNVVIKQLRERFNVEGDVNLVTDDQYYDVHAVASLLKLYLRELPTTILTRELHLDFLAVTELREVSDKIQALNGLVHRLPKCNLTLLRHLSSFLINIINHSDTNKMTVRNVGIVFSPTLNIPAPVLALFLQQYESIFDALPETSANQNTPVVTFNAAPLTPEDIRSPRRQMFQDLPTPSYNQTFPRNAPPSFPMTGQSQNDTGFHPIQPSYEQHGSFTMGGPEYGSQSQTLAGPSYDQYNSSSTSYRQNDMQGTSVKSKRRESSMFSIGLGQKKPAQKLKDDSRLVEDESFFE